MDSLNIDLFAKEVTYLPFDEVRSLCQTNKKAHEYCTNSRYSNIWKSLIDNTFSNLVDYQEKLQPLLEKYGGYNYLVYVNLVKTLDKVSQAMIYYRQGDMNNFGKMTVIYRFLALFLFGKKNEMKEMLRDIPGFKIFLDFLDGKNVNMNALINSMAVHGSTVGVNYFLSRGANINGSLPFIPLESAIQEKNFDMIKFLVRNGAEVTKKIVDRAKNWKNSREIINYLQLHKK